MPISAYLIDKNHKPVSEEYSIDHDDQFADLIVIARSQSQTAAIKWQRSTDGQAAYWGPNGAQFEPHWFNGNTNAQAGDNPATSTVIFRCTPAEKAAYVRAAQAENLKLTEWIKSRLI